MIVVHKKTKRKYFITTDELDYERGLVKARTLEQIKGSDILQKHMLRTRQWEKLDDFKVEVNL